VRLHFSTCFYLILLSLLPFISKAQTPKDTPAADSLFSGVWKGSSLCQVKNSQCHDENVVYYISKTNKDNILEIKANKIVNGEEVEMGKIQFQYDAKTKQIISTSRQMQSGNLIENKIQLRVPFIIRMHYIEL
jgi:hypothetical protein